MRFRGMPAAGAMVALLLAAPIVATAGLTEIQYVGERGSFAAQTLTKDSQGRIVRNSIGLFSSVPFVAREVIDLNDLSTSSPKYTHTDQNNWGFTGGDYFFYDASVLSGVKTFSASGTVGQSELGRGLEFYSGDAGGQSLYFMAYDDTAGTNTGFVELQYQDGSGNADDNSSQGAALSKFVVPISSTGGDYVDGVRIHGTPAGGYAARMWVGAAQSVYYFDVGARAGLVVDSGTPTYTVGSRSVSAVTALSLVDENDAAITSGDIVALDFDADGDLWVLRQFSGYANYYIEEYADQGSDTWKRMQSLHNQDNSFIPNDQWDGYGSDFGHGDRPGALMWYDENTLLLGEYSGWSGSYAYKQLLKFTVVAVPEPATLALLALGGLSLLARRRRSRQA